MPGETVTLNFRTHAYTFTVLEKVPPDFVTEYLMRRQATRLKLNEPNWPERRVSRDVKVALLNSETTI